MAAIATINPLNQFFALNGAPLNNGKLYFGEANKDPEQFPIQMYWDEAGLVPALQPIRTTSGYPARTGSPAILYCNSKYSLRVRQSNDVQVFYLAEAGSDVASAFGQFTPSNLTPSFVSSNSFTVTGDQTAILLPKLRLRLSVTSGFVYGTILTSVYGALTTVTLRMDTGQVLDAGLSSFDVSILKPTPSALPESTLPGAGIGISYTDGLPTISARVSLPINGGCQIAQQAVVAITAAYQYSQVDMHLAAVLAGTGLSGNLGQFAMTGAASGFGYGVSAGSWTTGNFNWQTRIQGVYTTRLNSKTVTVAAKIFQNTGGARNFKIALYKPTTTLDTFSAQTLLQTSANSSVPSSTATQISATFTLGASDATLGLAILVFDADAANTVVTKSYLISDWQIKAEQSASPFDLPEFDTELALCQKYYAKTFPYATAPAQNVTPGAVTNAIFARATTSNWGVQIRWNLPVPMRSMGTGITAVTYNPAAANANIRDNSAAGDVAITQVDVSGNSSVNVSSSISATAGNLIAIHITADCRL
jgi:hypothetical protein